MRAGTPRRSTKDHIPADIAVLMKNRDDARHANPGSPEVAVLSQQIQQQLFERKRDEWREKMENIDHRRGVSKLWSIVRSLSGTPRPPPNITIDFNGNQPTNPKATAMAFNKQFTTICNHKKEKKHRATRRTIKKGEMSPKDTFTPEDVRKAIKMAKSSKAAGPDHLTIFHLRHLGPIAISHLTELFNLSLSTCRIPQIWRTATVIPILKPGKPNNQGSSYRPISLLSPAIKVLERLVLPSLSQHLPIAPHQHGFRKQHSTTSALLKLTDHIATGFNQKKPPDRTIAVAVDLSKAFDTINHDQLLEKLVQSTLPPGKTRWLKAYLRGRVQRTLYLNELSSSRHVTAGVPQGAILSPLLFNFFVSDIPTPPDGVHIVSYADDVTIYSSGPIVQSITEAINSYLPTLEEYLRENNLMISPEKSTATLFTPHKAELSSQLDISVGNKHVPTSRWPKILGVTFDQELHFNHHVADVAARASARNSVLKALAGTDWGAHKETLLLTFKALCRPVLEYAAPVWSPRISATSYRKLQTVQNSALRTATGCHLKSSVEHLHTETKCLTVEEHCTLLSAQYLANALNPDRPVHPNTQLGQRPRKMKETLHSKHHEWVESALKDSTFDSENRVSNLKILHTEAVARALQEKPPNVVLRQVPPDIDKSEQELSRSDRCALAQLRSGHSIRLNSYRHILDPNISELCPQCNREPHTTRHLFACDLTNTDLTPVDLWLNPKKAALLIPAKPNM